MNTAVSVELLEALAQGLNDALFLALDAKRIRMPSRDADASAYLPDASRALPPCACMPDVFGTPPLAAWEKRNDRLLMTFSDALMDAIVTRVNETLPSAQNGYDDPVLSRMLLLSRHTGEGCPPDPAFRRALLYTLSACGKEGAMRHAKAALWRVFAAVPPRQRVAMLPLCGAYGDACARMIAYTNVIKE